MSRKDLEKFNPEKLKPGATRMFEVVNPQDHYHEVHYFCRDRDGELLSGVVHGFPAAHKAVADWKKLKHEMSKKFKQMELDLVSAGGSDLKQDGG